MARRKKSQSDIASQLGLSQAAVSRRLSGDVDFTSSQLVLLARYLDVPVASFFDTAALAESGDAA